MRWSVSLALSILLAACTRTTQEQIGPPIPTVAGKRCVLHMHGKSGSGGPTLVTDGITHLHPNGNAEGWGGRQWLYFPENQYKGVRDIVAGSIAAAGCDKVVVHGFSNGAAAATKLYCRGERLSGHVLGYVIDDPVVDRAADACKPIPGTKLKLYWTSALTKAVAGWPCKDADWTCEGGSTIGIARFAQLLSTQVAPSMHKTHAEYLTPPEYAEWLKP
jgi:hypothetical protein